MINQETDVELETTERQHWIDQYEALKRLRDNEDFKTVILEGYIKNKAVDGVSLLALPAVKKSGERGDIMEELVAVSNLQYHFQMLENLGSIAEQEALDEEFGEDEEA